MLIELREQKTEEGISTDGTTTVDAVETFDEEYSVTVHPARITDY